MPINIELPLEVNRPRDYPNISNPVIVDNILTVNYDEYSTVSFDAATGICLGYGGSDNALRIRNKSDEVPVKYYRIWFGHRDWGKSDWRYLQDDSIYQFEDGKVASDKAKALNKEASDAEAPWRFMVKSHTVMSPNHQWREWMRERFTTGEYAPMPWKDEPWAIADHFAHAGIADPFQVAFVESAVAGADDRMLILKPGRYLERFHSDILSAQDIAAWAAKVDSEAELCFAATPDEIVDVYVNGGIDSCMKYPADNAQFPLGVQPTSIYGAGDLQLAYLTRRGKTIARALVWPERKVVGRIYGDSERLSNRLIADGYTLGAGDRTTFDGARMLRIEVAGEIVMPYLDWSMGADDDGEFLIIRGNANGRATYKGQTTNGTASGRTIMICGHDGCRTRMDEDAGFYNSGTGRTMCGPCADRVLVRCVASNDFYPIEGRGAAPMLPVMSRDGVTPYPGFRGGMVNRERLSMSGQYRILNNIVYPRSETRLRPGTARTYEPIPVDA